MSAIEDLRKVAQDFIAPELRALTARVDVLEHRVEALDKKVDQNEFRAEQRHQDALKYSDQKQQELANRMEDFRRHMDQRFDDMSFLLKKAMEVQHLLDRVAALEERVKQPTH